MPEDSNTEQEQGIKWWIRHAIVPVIVALIGGAVLLIARGCTPPPVTTDTPEPPGTVPALPNWVTPFQLEFQPGFWSEGQHEYTLTLDCSGTLRDITAGNSFRVSKAVGTFPDPVYLRLDGLQRSRLALGPLTEINPSQRTLGLITLGHLTYLEAQNVLGGDCAAAISWDGLPAQSLVPQSPYQVAEDQALWQ